MEFNEEWLYNVLKTSCIRTEIDESNVITLKDQIASDKEHFIELQVIMKAHHILNRDQTFQTAVDRLFIVQNIFNGRGNIFWTSTPNNNMKQSLTRYFLKNKTGYPGTICSKDRKFLKFKKIRTPIMNFLDYLEYCIPIVRQFINDINNLHDLVDVNTINGYLAYLKEAIVYYDDLRLK